MGRRRRGEQAVPNSEGRGTAPGLNRSGDHPAFGFAEAKYVSGQFKLNLGVWSGSEERQPLTVCKFSSGQWFISLRKRAVQ